ncbi:DUF1772 domain-containing protein [Phreatobacter stygius]|uniref:DUF1772 domain-containing protein n=1 Tax=Phreatobacter stygius TaxID=1940610 RepID=A0A4D7BHU4_9HYPH|nr:anthrone oxygenase family protein [Phreatobacter stygius]QCI67387.1 DUF1772 domain-containing protein [Phreatobacter stygius]
MIDRSLFALTFAAALGSGVIGGTFFGFSAFIMQALGRIPPLAGMAAMRSINIVVINPVFLGAFIGTAVIAALLTVTALFRWSEPGAAWLVAGCLLYVVGTFVVTMVFNVPLNDALEAVQPESPEGAALWTRYLTDWTMWNTVRTWAGLAAAAALTVSLCLQFRSIAGA